MTTNEPIERTLARIEAMGELISDLAACPHCHQRFIGHGHSEGGQLPRAIGIVHESDCPIEIELENTPAAEYVIGDDGTVQ